MRTATIRTSPGGIDLSTPYDADFVDAPKATVPFRARKWDGNRKVWTVSHAHIAEAVQLLRQYFHVVDLHEYKAKTEREQREREQEQQRQREQQRQQQQERERRYSHGSSSYAVLHLQPTAPSELIKAAFHVLALLHHPDRGGDLATMQKINHAYEELKR
jgi:phage/plasmid primase-like uncharacterized protein